MQPKEQLAERLGEAYGFLNEVVDHKLESVKLSVAEKTALLTSKVLTGVVIAVFGSFFGFFGLIALAFLIAGAEDYATGFGIISLVMLVILLAIVLLRRYIIVNPAVSRVISLFFSDPKASDHAGK